MDKARTPHIPSDGVRLTRSVDLVREWENALRSEASNWHHPDSPGEVRYRLFRIADDMRGALPDPSPGYEYRPRRKSEDLLYGPAETLPSGAGSG